MTVEFYEKKNYINALNVVLVVFRVDIKETRTISLTFALVLICSLTALTVIFGLYFCYFYL